MAKIKYREALRAALREEMLRDETVFCIGEGIGERGGSYKVTEGLFAEFGPRRVIDTPSQRGRLRRARGRRRDRRRAAGRGDALRRLPDAGDGPGRQPGGEVPLHVRRRGPRPPGHPHPGRRGQLAGRPALAEPGGALLPRARAEGRHAGDAGRRQGPAQVRHPRRRPGDLHRAQAALHDRRRGSRTRSISSRSAWPT